MEKKPISRAGFDALLKELKDLKENQRPEILKIVQWARSLGDLSENADYSAAKEKQRQIDKRIQFIEGVVGNANVGRRRRGWQPDAVPHPVGHRGRRAQCYIVHVAGGACAYWALRW